MAKTFDKVITFHIQGEIYDNDTRPESILNNYIWTFEDNLDGNIQLFAHHKDKRGRITNMTKLSKIGPWKKPKQRIRSIY